MEHLIMRLFRANETKRTDWMGKPVFIANRIIGKPAVTGKEGPPRRPQAKFVHLDSFGMRLT